MKTRAAIAAVPTLAPFDPGGETPPMPNRPGGGHPGGRYCSSQLVLLGAVPALVAALLPRLAGRLVRAFTAA